MLNSQRVHSSRKCWLEIVALLVGWFCISLSFLQSVGWWIPKKIPEFGGKTSTTPAGKRHVSTWPFQIPVHTLSAFQFSAEKAALLAWRTARLIKLDQCSASCGKNVCCDALLSWVLQMSYWYHIIYRYTYIYIYACVVGMIVDELTKWILLLYFIVMHHHLPDHGGLTMAWSTLCREVRTSMVLTDRTCRTMGNHIALVSEISTPPRIPLKKSEQRSLVEVKIWKRVKTFWIFRVLACSKRLINLYETSSRCLLWGKFRCWMGWNREHPVFRTTQIWCSNCRVVGIGTQNWLLK